MLAVLVANDYALKRTVPSELTGKLSDIAGLVLLPLAFLSLTEGVRFVSRRRHWQATTTELCAALAVTAIGFTAVKLSTMIASAYGYALGFLRWLPAAAAAFVTQDGVPLLRTVSVTHDVTDLLVLPVLVVVWFNVKAAIQRQTYESRQRPCTQTSGL
jgi:hypothetical protein